MKSQVRIPLIAAVVTLLFLTALAIIARNVVRNVTFADLDEELETLSIAVSSDLELEGLRALQDRTLHTGIENNVLAFRLEHHSAILVDDGKIVATSGLLTRNPSAAAARQIAKHPEGTFIASEPFSGQQRQCRFRVTHLSGAAPGATLIMFRSIEPTLRTLRSLDLALLAIVLLGVAGSAAITALAVRRALQPVEEVTRIAETAQASDLSRRVDESRGGEEVRRLSRVINSLFDRLQVSFQSQRRLVADAAHELKTPVAAIVAEAQEAKRADTPDDQRATLLASIEKSARALARETNDLLTLARGETASANNGNVDLKNVASTVLEAFAPAARSRGIRPDLRARGDVTIAGDEAAIERAMMNLVSNAIAYSNDDADLLIEVSGYEHDVAISIGDRGPGVAAEDRNRIFERFVRLPDARRRNPEGSGLGLAIVAQTVQNHGGTVKIEDHIGGGALFTIRLPRRR